MSTSCPFCELAPTRVRWRSELVSVFPDGYPVSPGHMLIVPHRHVATLFEATRTERGALLEAVEVARSLIERDHRPDGYNVGVNSGAAAGQTVPHLHVHVIPRYRGDVRDPRGGVRWVVPDKAAYWERSDSAEPEDEPRT